ncbi:MAG: hypothetical protein ACOCSK_03155 [Rhodothermales bacterium]
MNSLYELSQTYYEDVFREAPPATGLEEGIVEKDLWVLLALDRIFPSDRYGRHFVFKGGSSLSKVHKIIEGFSEEVAWFKQRFYYSEKERYGYDLVRRGALRLVLLEGKMNRP